MIDPVTGWPIGQDGPHLGHVPPAFDPMPETRPAPHEMDPHLLDLAEQQH